MLRPRLALRPRPQLCQICEALATRRVRVASRHIAAFSTDRGRIATSKCQPPASGTSRALSTAKDKSPRPSPAHAQPRKPLDLDNLVASMTKVKKALLQQDGIPQDANVSAALRTCEQAAELIVDATKTEYPADTAASTLLSLDANGQPSSSAAAQNKGGIASVRIKATMDKISETALSIIRDPNVFLSPQALEQYVKIQARLGRPETLPEVLVLYSSKPLPRGTAGSITYVKQNPNKASNAVSPAVAETALDAAIEAKNLDAAVAIVEATYASTPHKRSRLIKKALFPATVLASLPFTAYVGASQLSALQNTMDQTLATNIAFVGAVSYVAFTGSIWAIWVTTTNDHMKRVSWAPGTPLSQRWLREDERAAFDKIACSFGFAESTRYGEEEGAEFLTLKEYIAERGMMLDRAELMEGLGG